MQLKQKVWPHGMNMGFYKIYKQSMQFNIFAIFRVIA